MLAEMAKNNTLSLKVILQPEGGGEYFKPDLQIKKSSLNFRWAIEITLIN